MAVLAGLGTAFPPPVTQAELWEGYFSRHFAGAPIAERVFRNSGVTTRHTVLNPLTEDVSGWSTGQRMRRYVEEAVPLGKEAVLGALADAGVGVADVGLLAVATCTGYATPGLDLMLARDLGFDPALRRLVIGHMGCYAALPGLGAVADYVDTHGKPAVLLCVELTSLHGQPPTTDTGQIISHALFSDAAAAVVVTPAGPGYEIRGVAARTDATTADHMTWEVTDLGFRMGLSPRVPGVLARHVGPLVAELTAGVTVDGWAVHPGGPRILEVTQEQLGLPPSALAASRRTLAEHGNCSSATVLLVLDSLRAQEVPPSTVAALAFGPGLTLYGALLTS
ncbi:type III polyketide synthase [Longispora albida]|uniref:type III polyketide synthase n=1 Tax=Longispora albida TaxID=203523 RepID=UPI00035FB644|nr:type III polyketide synthase [Longispora albida]